MRNVVLYVLVLLSLGAAAWSTRRAASATADAESARASARRANDRLDKVVDWNDVVAPCNLPKSLDQCWGDWMRLTDSSDHQLQMARLHH